MPFSSISPSAPDYVGQCRSIAQAFLSGSPAFIAFEHDGQHAQLMITPMVIAEWFGEPEGIGETGAWAAVAVINGGAHWFPLQGFIGSHRLSEKLRVGPAIGAAIAELLVRIGIELKGVR